MELREAVNPDHIDRDSNVPVGPWVIESRGEVNIAGGMVVVEDQGVEDHRAQERHLVVDVSCCRAMVVAPGVSQALHAKVGLDKVP